MIEITSLYLLKASVVYSTNLRCCLFQPSRFIYKQPLAWLKKYDAPLRFWNYYEVPSVLFYKHNAVICSKFWLEYAKPVVLFG